MKPPRLPRWLLERVLPEPERHAVIGDLDEEFRAHILPARGARRASLWYWRQCLLSLPAAITIDARRRHPPRRTAREPFVAHAIFGIARDLRYAVIVARRQPGFTAAALATYALAVAVTTAVATLAYIVLLRPLPYAFPERLVHLAETDPNEPDDSGTFSYPDFVTLRDRTRAFERVAGYSGGSRTLAAGGSGLSAGEAQLLALARVFLRDPRVVVLDEASSRLDPATERRLERALDRLLAGRAAIIVAHRLGTLQRADRIVILEEGRVQEQGLRIDLAADSNSRYAALLRTGMEEVLA